MSETTIRYTTVGGATVTATLTRLSPGPAATERGHAVCGGCRAEHAPTALDAHDRVRAWANQHSAVCRAN